MALGGKRFPQCASRGVAFLNLSPADFARYLSRMSILPRLVALVVLLPVAAVANTKLPWENWMRFCYPPEMNAEWFIAEDHTPANRATAPEDFVVHTLVQPRAAKSEHYWEITFDPTTKKKALLAAHFDNDKASDPVPGGFRMTPQQQGYWYAMDVPGPTNFWLLIKPRENLEGQFPALNVDPDHSGKPTAYTLVPNNAVLVSFFEPVITSQDGEWTISFPHITAEQKKHLANYAADWLKHHPGPKLVRQPIHYSPTMQKQYEAWEKANKAWQVAGGHGLSPTLESFFNFTPEQTKQYEAYQKAYRVWCATGQGPYPQPIDFLPEPAPAK